MPCLATILKRMAHNQICVAHHFANGAVRDDNARHRIEAEARAIAAELQAFTDVYQIRVAKREGKPAPGSGVPLKTKC
jgi:hypothetical protein